MTLIGKLIKRGSIGGSLPAEGVMKGSIPGAGKLHGVIAIENGQEKARVGSAIVGTAVVCR